VKTIMYHYIKPDFNEYQYFNYLDIDIFKRQLDFFEEEWGFLSKEEFFECIENNRLSENVVLTFDDGLKDHYAEILPILLNKKIWGIFYIPTGVHTTDKKQLLGVHRVHYLKGKYGAETILEKALSLVADTMLDTDLIGEFDKEIYTHSHYTEAEKSLRRLFNYFVSYDYRDKLLDELMKYYFDENTLFDEVYMTQSEISELASYGSIVGSHTVSHRVLSRLSYDEQRIEVKKSFDYLDSFLNLEVKSFCYPYGYKSSYNYDTLKVLEQLGVHHAFVFDNQIENQGKIRPYEISRIDCNQFLEV